VHLRKDALSNIALNRVFICSRSKLNDIGVTPAGNARIVVGLDECASQRSCTLIDTGAPWPNY
jgi:hypothetical protein